MGELRLVQVALLRLTSVGHLSLLVGDSLAQAGVTETLLSQVAGRARPDEPEVVGGVQEEGW